MNTLELIKHSKSICFYGLGRENLALIRYLAKNALISEIIYCDQQPFTEALPLPSQMIVASDLAKYSIIFKAPGVSLYQESIQLALQSGVRILSPNQLFFDLNPAFKICVTGSKGKSTFSKLLMELLSAVGVKVVAAGNIGLPLMDLVDSDFDVAVIELSSYQLASLEIKPDIAVITSLFPEHLSWHLSIAQYYQDKLHIADGAKNLFVINQKTADFLDLEYPQIDYQQINYPIIDRQISLLSGQKITINNSYFYPKHLQSSLQGALGVIERSADILGFSWEGSLPLIQEAINRFEGLPHRLEVFLEQANFLAIDDSISTAPEAVVAALEAFSEYQIHLFLGGYSKGTSQQVIIDYLNQHPEVFAYCYSITGKTVFEELGSPAKAYTEKLSEAVASAWSNMKLAEAENLKHLFLLSPGAASFDQFRDFEDRGRQFKELIKDYFLK